MKQGLLKRIFKKPIRLVFLTLLIILFISFFEPDYRPVALRHFAQLSTLPKQVLSDASQSGHPKNTLQALTYFLESDKAALLLKVQITDDDHFIVFSDQTLNDNTDGEGAIHEKKLKDLECVYYDKGETQAQYSLLTLDNALKKIDGQKKLFIQVLTSRYVNEDQAKSLSAVIHKHRAYPFVVVQSLNPFFLSALRKVDPEVMIQYDFITPNHKRYIGLMYEFTDISWVYQWHWLQKQMIRKIKPDLLGVHYTTEKSILEGLLKKNYPIYIWGVNDADIAKSFADVGIIGYQTNQAFDFLTKQENDIIPSDTEQLLARMSDALKTNKKINQVLSYRSSNQAGAINVRFDRLKHVLYHQESNLLEVEAGASFQEIQEYLIQLGRTLAIYPFDAKQSVAQAIAYNSFGPGFERSALIDQINSITLLLPNGEIVETDRNTNPELFSATIGGMGLLGLVVSAKFKTIDNLKLARMRDNEDDVTPKVFWYNAHEVPTNKEEMQKNAYKMHQPISLAFDLIKTGSVRKMLKKVANEYSDSDITISNNVADDLFKVTESKDISLNELAYSWSEPKAMLSKAVGIEKATYIIPVEAVNQFFEALKSYHSANGFQLVKIKAVHLKEEKSALLKFAKNSGIALHIYWKVNTHDEKAQTEFKNNISLLTEKVLNMNGNFHLSNLEYNLEQLKRGYPEIKDLKNLKHKYDPSNRLMLDHQTLKNYL